MNRSKQTLPDALVIIGPTGSGKTPLGKLIEKTGLHGRSCFHFDFGESLRRYSASPDGSLSLQELRIINESLFHGTLLEDRHFSIADKLLAGFINSNIRSPRDLVIMNGLPRHIGQAMALRKRIRVTALLLLKCTPETVLERIRQDTGGDRGSREDDELEKIIDRLKIFNQRTIPLIDHYREHGVPAIEVPVGSQSTAEEILSLLRRKAWLF